MDDESRRYAPNDDADPDVISIWESPVRPASAQPDVVEAALVQPMPMPAGALGAPMAGPPPAGQPAPSGRRARRLAIAIGAGLVLLVATLLGVILFELVAGRRPFYGDLLQAHLTAEPPDPREYVADLPPGLVGVIGRCLQKRPEDRYPSVVTLRGALAACHQAMAGYVPALPPSPEEVRDPLRAGDDAVLYGALRRGGV